MFADDNYDKDSDNVNDKDDNGHLGDDELTNPFW